MQLKWLPYWQALPSLQRNSETLEGWLLGSWTPPWPRPFLPIYQRSTGSSKLLPFHKYWGHSAPGITQSVRNGFMSWSLPWHNFITEFYREFFELQGLVFVLTCNMNCGTLYTKVCAHMAIFSIYNLIYNKECKREGIWTSIIDSGSWCKLQSNQFVSNKPICTNLRKNRWQEMMTIKENYEMFWLTIS